MRRAPTVIYHVAFYILMVSSQVLRCYRKGRLVRLVTRLLQPRRPYQCTWRGAENPRVPAELLPGADNRTPCIYVQRLSASFRSSRPVTHSFREQQTPTGRLSGLSFNEVMAASSSTPQQAPYHGQDLGPGEIRLLTIEIRSEPSLQHVYPWQSKKETLHLITQQCTLEDKPDFDAVSYVWGTAPASISVPCNGGSVLITPSARHMLEHLRLQNRPLWIDAICIDQQNADEKATQIPLMRQIYTDATFVVVWLGASNPSIYTFMVDFPRVSDLARSWTIKFVTIDTNWRGEGWPPDGDEFWVGAYYILDHEWFRRLWTFQEIALARRAVLISESTWINAYDFFVFTFEGISKPGGYFYFDQRVASRLPNKPSFLRLAFETCDLIMWYRRNSYITGASEVETDHLAGLLYGLQPRGVQEAVDRVWAITALLKQSLQDQLAPLVDYSERGRVEYRRTFVRFAKSVFVAGQSLTLLDLPPSAEKDNGPLPSWCPEFSKPSICTHGLAGQWNFPLELHVDSTIMSSENDDKESSFARRYAVLSHPLKFISITEDDQWLQTRGYVIDTISEVIEDEQLVGQLDYNHESQWDHWALSSPIQAAAISFYTRGLDLARRTFSGPSSPVSEIPLQYLMSVLVDCRIGKNAERAYQDGFSLFTATDYDCFCNLEKKRQRQGFSWLRKIRANVGHSFFATKGGRFGIATPGCRSGDKVCTFYGGEPLYILRQSIPKGKPDAEHPEEPAVFCGTAFIPHLMEQHQRDNARLGNDEIFTIE
jgi:hypothetical protein